MSGSRDYMYTNVHVINEPIKHFDVYHFHSTVKGSLKCFMALTVKNYQLIKDNAAEIAMQKDTIL